MNKNWYAVYTKPQCEKKVVAQLSRKRIESFSPVNRRIIGNGSRKKLVTEALFPGFVFVHIMESQITAVKQTGDVINFMHWLGKPAIIKEAEVENIYHFASSYHNIHLAKIPVNPANTIRITNIPKPGTHTGISPVTVSTIKISLPSIGYAMQAEATLQAEDAFNFIPDSASMVN